MKTPLRQRWALYVVGNSRFRVWPYCCLVMAITITILDFTFRSHDHYLPLLFGMLTMVSFERLGFAELLAAKDREIQKLQSESNASA